MTQKHENHAKELLYGFVYPTGNLHLRVTEVFVTVYGATVYALCTTLLFCQQYIVHRMNGGGRDKSLKDILLIQVFSNSILLCSAAAITH